LPSLANHQSNEFTKLLLTGDSGGGKTGAKASLVGAGYHLFCLDMDNGLDPLKTFVQKQCPQFLGNVNYRTLRDNYKTTAAGPVVDKPRAFVDAMKMLDHWKFTDTDGTEVDFGKPSEWGPDCILDLDSLSFFSDAAFEWARGMNPTAKDPRQWFYSAQQAVESALALLTSGSFKTNVIVSAHVRYSTGDDGRNKGYPNAIGSALGPTIPRYFNHWAQCENKAGKRIIRTTANAMFDLKNTKPFEMKNEYDLSTGLADFFAVLRDPPAKPVPPKAVTLKRV
jgi:AAA domain